MTPKNTEGREKDQSSFNNRGLNLSEKCYDFDIEY
jgi:hypothetical protein